MRAGIGKGDLQMAVLGSGRERPSDRQSRELGDAEDAVAGRRES